MAFFDCVLKRKLQIKSGYGLWVSFGTDYDWGELFSSHNGDPVTRETRQEGCGALHRGSVHGEEAGKYA